MTWHQAFQTQLDLIRTDLRSMTGAFLDELESIAPFEGDVPTVEQIKTAREAAGLRPLELRRVCNAMQWSVREGARR